MILKVRELKENVAEAVEGSYNSKSLDLEFNDLHYLDKISIHGIAEKGETMLMFRGTLDSRLEHTCNRCLSQVAEDLHKPFELSYQIENRDEIDTTDDLRDLLILSRPEQFVCSESCRGMCTRCGANLNQSTCACEKPAEGRNSWAPIKDILDRKER